MNRPSASAIPSRDPSRPVDREFDGLPRRATSAWVLSILLHSSLMIALIVALYPFSRGGSDIESRTGGIVLVQADAQTTEYLSEGEVDDASSRPTSSESAPTTDSELPPDLPGFESWDSTIDGVGEDLAESLTGADSLLEGMNANRAIGGKVTTEVFGVRGTGSRFVYLFDRSASMEGYEGKPLRAAKKALLASLASLGDRHQFQIIFYNDRTRVFRPAPGSIKLIDATEEMKQKATRFVNSVRGDRGTNHMNALKEALALAPDVIFLLTDAEGGFTPTELNRVSRWNRAGTIINSIEFGVGAQSSGDHSLERLSQESGGQYTYKNVLSFRD